MEVKLGYKQAEAEVFAAGWRDCDISDLCTLQRGFDLTEATRKPGAVPVYSSSGLSYFHSEAKLQPPAVITGRKGLLGRVFLVEEPCWPHDTTLWVKDFKGNDPRFVAVFLSQFRLGRFDAATSVPTLNRNNLVGHPIRLPSPPEQRTIATALSDVDVLLGGLDRLIAKKRGLKLAAMQQLLTGQTRLPGFRGKWQDGRLADVIGALEAGVSVNSRDDNGDGAHHESGILKTSAVAGGRFIPHECKRIAARDVARARLNPKRDTLLISRMNTRHLVGECGYVDRDYPNLFVPDRLWMTRLRQGSDTCALWLSYLLTSPKMKRLIGAVATGTSGTMKNLSKRAFLEVPTTFPPGREQAAIAGLLCDMDAELVALEQRRDKTRLLKHGVMQELLTGRTRLVSTGGVHA